MGRERAAGSWRGELMRVTELPRCGGVAVELAGRPAALTDAELAQLRHLLDTRGVLVVRPAVDGAGGAGCESVEDFTAFCRSLGTLHDDVNGPGRGRPELRGLGDEVHYISNLDLATDTAMDGPTSMLSDGNADWHACVLPTRGSAAARYPHPPPCCAAGITRGRRSRDHGSPRCSASR